MKIHFKSINLSGKFFTSLQKKKSLFSEVLKTLNFSFQEVIYFVTIKKSFILRSSHDFELFLPRIIYFV